MPLRPVFALAGGLAAAAVLATSTASAANIAVLKVRNKTIMLGQTAAALRTLKPLKPVSWEKAVDPKRPDDPNSPLLTYHFDVDGQKFTLVYAVVLPGPAARIIRITVPDGSPAANIPEIDLPDVKAIAPGKAIFAPEGSPPPVYPPPPKPKPAATAPAATPAKPVAPATAPAPR